MSEEQSARPLIEGHPVHGEMRELASQLERLAKDGTVLILQAAGEVKFKTSLPLESAGRFLKSLLEARQALWAIAGEFHGLVQDAGDSRLTYEQAKDNVRSRGSHD